MQALIARRVGEGRDGEVGQILGSAMVVVFGAGAIACVLGLLWPEFWMSLVSRDPTVRALGAGVPLLALRVLLPFLLDFHFRACFDGIGWTRIGMVTAIGMNVVNVILNWVLIFGKLGAPALGGEGRRHRQRHREHAGHRGDRHAWRCGDRSAAGSASSRAASSGATRSASR